MTLNNEINTNESEIILPSLQDWIEFFLYEEKIHNKLIWRNQK